MGIHSRIGNVWFDHFRTGRLPCGIDSMTKTPKGESQRGIREIDRMHTLCEDAMGVETLHYQSD